MRAFLILAWMTLLTGIAYPLAITMLAETFAPHKAGGSILTKNGTVIGSQLIAQRFKSGKYFWPRPSEVDYNTLASGGTDYGQGSAALAAKLEERRKFWEESHPGIERNIPDDLLFASASGLDPHISQSAAYFQLPRVAGARQWSPEQLESARRIIDHLVEHNPKVFPGEAGVNVLMLNLAIDQI